jgi:hypothetical protein
VLETSQQTKWYFSTENAEIVENLK